MNIREIRTESILFFYDNPQVILGRDEKEAFYVGLLADGARPLLLYIFAPAAPRDVIRFLAGITDLRSLFDPCPEGMLFAVGSEGMERPGEVCAAMPLGLSVIPEKWLPDQGFFMIPDIKDDGIREAFHG